MPEPGQELGHLLRRLRDGEEIAEQQRADQDGEHGRRGARGLQQRAQDVLAATGLPSHDADQEGAARARARGLGGGEQAAVEPADHEGEQQQRRPDVAACASKRSLHGALWPAGRKPGRA